MMHFGLSGSFTEPVFSPKMGIIRWRLYQEMQWSEASDRMVIATRPEWEQEMETLKPRMCRPQALWIQAQAWHILLLQHHPPQELIAE
jgi:hypothetical protein